MLQRPRDNPFHPLLNRITRPELSNSDSVMTLVDVPKPATTREQLSDSIAFA